MSLTSPKFNQNVTEIELRVLLNFTLNFYLELGTIKNDGFVPKAFLACIRMMTCIVAYTKKGV